MEVLVNTDKTVYKFIHNDGSETAIKFVNSCSCDETPRNKYSIFVSSSVGCQLSCKFCYLTTKEIKYHSLTEEQILNNLKEAIEYFINENEELKKYYVKICWMGMGEDGIIKTNLLYNVTTKILNYILEEKQYAIGLDGIDVSTVLPNNSNLKVYFDLIKLNQELTKYILNPNNTTLVNVENSSFNNYENRSIVRLFYSLHSANNDTRQNIIPNAIDLENSIEFLKFLNKEINIIFHQFFINELNDTDEEIDKLIELILKLNYEMEYFELRILRLNSCEKLSYIESKKFDQIINKLKDKTKIFKVQVSAGNEIKAACGQFLMKKMSIN